MHIRKTGYLLSSLVGLLWLVMTSQTAHSQRYNFRHYGLKDGLIQSQVGFVVEDEAGYLWIGHLAGGVARFDGHDFVRYDYEGDHIGLGVAIDGAFDDDGDLWVQSDRGIFYKKGQTFHFYGGQKRLSPPLGLARIHRFAPDSLFLFSGNPGTVSIILGHKDEVFSDSLPDEFAQEMVMNIVEHPTKANAYLLATNLGTLITFHQGTYTRAQIAAPEITALTDLMTDADGQLWAIGVEGIFTWDGTVWSTQRSQAELGQARPLRITQQQNGAVWVSSLHGAFRFWNNRVDHFRQAEGLTDNQIMGLYADRENNMWFWTQGEGMFAFRGDRFRYITAQEGLEAEVVMALEPYQDRILIGTYGNGVYEFEPDGGITRKWTQANSGLPSDQALAGYTAQNGDVLIGFRNGGFARYNGTHWKSYEYSPQLGNSLTNAFAEDTEGNLWVADLGKGLYQYQGDDYIRWSTQDGLPSNIIRTLYYHEEDSALWVGTKKGIVQLKNGQITSLPFSDSLRDFTLWGVNRDTSGTVWMALLWGGVASWDGTTLRHYTTEDGLSSNLTYLHEWDQAGHLYLGSERGLDKITFSAEHTISGVHHYGYADGFLGIENNGKTSWVDEQGRLWFGTVEGVMILDPRYDQLNVNPPATHITGVDINYVPANWAAFKVPIDSVSGLPLARPEFHHEQNTITFHFIGISLESPEQVDYGYRLIGEEATWSPIVDINQVTYSNLSPGEYTFQVIARNRDQFSSPTPTEFIFYIRPPLWQRPWFITLAALAGIGLLYLVFHLRTRQLRRAKEVLEFKVRHRTEEIMAQKEEIEAQRDMIEQKNNDITDSIRYAERIQKAILPLRHKIDEAFPRHFIFYQPRDIVSGDFFWFAEKNGLSFLAAVDCTGHGVPGAFMSLIAAQHLNQLVIEEALHDPAEILTTLHERVQATLHQKRKDSESRDGLDIALICHNPAEKCISFAGAKRPLYIVREGTLQEIKGDRTFIGGTTRREYNIAFSTQKVSVAAPTTIYLTSDGYADQFGGPEGRKFMVRRLKTEFEALSAYPVGDQATRLQSLLDDWMTGYPQTDDILIIGVQFP